VADRFTLADVGGFVFDIDGTMVLRGPDHRARVQPGAVAVIEAIRASGRPFVLFTNGSHIPAVTIARELQRDGLPVHDDEVMTPIESAITHLRRRHPGRPVHAFASAATAERMADAGIPLTDGEDAEAVFVAHVDHVDFSELERAARAITRGAPLLTGSYVPGYAGSGGMIFSRGAMVTAALAKVTGARPKVIGKPSRVAIAEAGLRLGLPTQRLAVIGDDAGMDVALGRLGGAKTVLVRSGISGTAALDALPARSRPDAVVDSVADLLERL